MMDTELNNNDSRKQSMPVSSTEHERIAEFEQQVREMTIAANAFFNNKFEEAMELASEKSEYSLPHSHGKAMFKFFTGALTLEPDDIEQAREAIKKTLELCNSMRKTSSIRKSITSLFFKNDYNEYKELECQAELCYAECNVMLGFLTFLGRQSIGALVKAALRLATANSSMNLLHQLYKHRTNWVNDYTKMIFDGGVTTGIGASNLMMSHLPERVLKVIALAGISGNRDLGLKYLSIATSLTESPRIQLASSIVLSYNIYLEQVFGIGSFDVEWTERLCKMLLQKHPEGGIVKFLVARTALTSGRVDEAIRYYNECLSLQSKWKPIDNISKWDLIACHCLLRQWDLAAKYALELRHECTWAPAINLHQYAGALEAKIDSGLCTEDEKIELRAKVEAALAEVPSARRRFAGKSLPLEKYAVERSRQYFDDQRKSLLVPIYEIYYVWNIFPMASNRPDILKPILDDLDRHLKKNDQKLDDHLILLLLKGVCLKYLEPKSAINCFREILEHESKVDKGSYILPHAALELGLVYMKLNQDDEARHWIEMSRTAYGTKFLMEATLHLRCHAALRQMDTKHHKGIEQGS